MIERKIVKKGESVWSKFQKFFLLYLKEKLNINNFLEQDCLIKETGAHK